MESDCKAFCICGWSFGSVDVVDIFAVDMSFRGMAVYKEIDET